MKKILLSAFTLGIVAFVAVYATNAFFSDTEKSEGNRFVAGKIDLMVDSEAHYAGLVCLDGYWIAEGEVTRSDLLGLPCFGSWVLTDLGPEHKFFDYTDVKPGDHGENTISLHVYDNDAYVCAIIDNMVDSENDIVEPEAEAGDVTPEVGELSQEIRFFAWDDGIEGNNIWEEGEEILFSNVEGPASDVIDGVVYPMYTPQTGPMVASTTRYIGLYWCYGDIAVEENNLSCDGVGGTNMTQTDSLSADITFYVEQARNNEGFSCEGVIPVSRHVSLENKNESWSIISDDQTYGDIEYSHNDTSLKGVVTGTGLEANGYYQITLNGPYDGCSFTNLSLGNFGANTFESGFWNSAWPNLSSTCTGDDEEGLYNMNLIGDHYTFQADGSGAFNYPFDLALPAGDYVGVKVLVKKMLDTHESPWVDTLTVHTTNLFETAPISFTIL